MPGTAVPLGPFTGGMQNISGLATLPDDTLAWVENFEQDIDNSLVSRPAIVPEQDVSVLTGELELLGYYVPSGGATYLVFTDDGETKLYDVATKAVTTIWANEASGFVQYDNKAVLISSTMAGGYWQSGLFTSTPTMPLADGIVFYQERFWAWGTKGTVNETTVWFSDLTVISPPSTIYDWQTSTNFFTVSNGDGQWITKLQPDVSSLLIFRSASTYHFSFPTAPASGTLKVLSQTIGAENKYSVVAYESQYFIFSAGFLYQFINYRFFALNVKKIDFQRGNLANPLQFDVRLSIFGRRALVWFYGALYCYKVVTGTWSIWESPDTRAGYFLTIPASSVSGESRQAIGITGEDDAPLKRLWRVEEDVLTTGTGEPMTCFIRTKAYSFDEYAQYKRLLWTAVSAVTAAGLEVSINPVALSAEGTTWNDMEDYNWNDFGTWNNPLVQPVEYVDDVEFPTMAPVMTVTKIRAAIRFLFVYFEVYITTSGTAGTGPVRIIEISPYLKVKATVAKKVN